MMHKEHQHVVLPTLLYATLIILGAYVLSLHPSGAEDLSPIQGLVLHPRAGTASHANITLHTEKSYPRVGGSWTLRISAVGTRDLAITGHGSTRYGYDLIFQELRCGNESIPAEYDGTRIIARKYACSEDTIVMNRVLTAGVHELAVTFGNEERIARNFAGRLAMEWNTLTLYNESYTQVNLTNYYIDPVIVAVPHYQHAGADAGPPYPMGVRITNITNTSFAIKIDRASGALSGTAFRADYFVMDSGNYTFPGTSVSIQAGKVSTTKYGRSGGSTWSDSTEAEFITFPSTFSSAPGVLHTRCSDTIQASGP
ncbi:MAG: hypothetical protein HC945_02030 [Nitrosarchaeum sp.]|nr:hypothetical protein [Nitrosarchaeum sp.]